MEKYRLLTLPTEGMNCPSYVKIEFAFSLESLNDKFCFLLGVYLPHLLFKTNVIIVKFKFYEMRAM